MLSKLPDQLPQQELQLQQRRAHQVPMVDSARRLDTKENHKVVVKEEGKPDQKYMSLTEPLDEEL